MEADDAAAAGDAAGRLTRYCRAPTCSGAAEPRCAPGGCTREGGLPRGRSSASAPLSRGDLQPSSCPSTRHPRARAAPSSGPGLGWAAQTSAWSLARNGVQGSDAPAGGPAASVAGLGPQSPDPSVPPDSRRGGAGIRGAERTDLEVQRHLPGRRRRSAPRAPEGRERRRAPPKPQPPAGSLRRSLARPFSLATVAFEAPDRAGPAGWGERGRAGPTGRGPGAGI